MDMRKIMKNILAGAVTAALLPAAAVSAYAAENKPHETTDTIGTVASVSKVFVSAAAMQLADQGKLDIDAPVTDYLPEFRLADPRYKDITVRMLMDHTSGMMGTYNHDSMCFGYRSRLPHDNFLKNISGERLKAAPGEYAAYCNDGFNVLELVVERVSGEDYTDYLENHICKPLGLQQTGTPWNAFETAEQMKVFMKNTEYPADYCLNVGEGGVLSTASELSRFGSAFFTGNTVLLSDKAKKEMSTCNRDDPYVDGFGLGWDEVSYQEYEEAGVKILSKGGDLVFQHSELLVAPDDEISVGVISSGGSSTYNTQLAMALMDIALEEKGISISRNKPDKKELLDSIPEEYLKYEGIYMDSQSVYQMSFPQKKYMKFRDLCDRTQPDINFMYTSDGVFVKVTGNAEKGNVSQDSDNTAIRFAEKNGKVYLTKSSLTGDDTFGYLSWPECYSVQQLEENSVSDSVQAAWNARNKKHYYICNECASSVAYSSAPSAVINIPEGVHGYVNNLKIKDSTHAESVLHIPTTVSRDQTDYEIIEENGAEYLIMDSSGQKCISEDAIPDLTADMTGVKLTSGAASWYNTDRGTLTLDIPENAAVYVYDSYDRLTWSSYMKNSGSTVQLPFSGKIVFIGETGSTIGIRQ